MRICYVWIVIHSGNRTRHALTQHHPLKGDENNNNNAKLSQTSKAGRTSARLKWRLIRQSRAIINDWRLFCREISKPSFKLEINLQFIWSTELRIKEDADCDLRSGRSQLLTLENRKCRSYFAQYREILPFYYPWTLLQTLSITVIYLFVLFEAITFEIKFVFDLE